MPKRKRVEEIPEELPTPEEELPGEVLPEEEIPRVGLRPTPGLAEDKETQWTSIDVEITRIKDDFIAGRIATLDDAIDQLTTALGALKTARAPGLAGLGVRPEMMFPPGPAIPPEEILPVV